MSSGIIGYAMLQKSSNNELMAIIFPFNQLVIQRSPYLQENQIILFTP
jgi:hypothetical protein